MTFKIRASLSLLWLAAVGGCGHSAGIQPHDMGVGQHEAAAAKEEREAAETTAAQKPIADRHRGLAAQHRAASLVLRDIEVRECAGLSEEDRDASPFAHGADISSVTLLREQVPIGRTVMWRDAGATILFRATPGLTAEWLRRVIECHLARNAVIGHDMPGMSSCPLVPRGAHAAVRSVGDGFAVDVRAGDAAAAAEIWRRAQQIELIR